MSYDSNVETLDICSKCFNVYENTTHHVCPIRKSEVERFNESLPEKNDNIKLLEKNDVPLTEDMTTPVLNSVWTDANTSFMLECFHQYMEHIGPMKKFKNKKAMWTQIKEDIEQYGYTFSEVQIENRYKTVLKRNRTAAKNNNTSGSSPKFNILENEFAKITALDDSIEPAVQVGTSSSGLKQIVKEDNKVQKKFKKSKTSVTDILLAIHKEKEENRRQREINRQKRHEEKMDILKTLLNNK